MSWATAFLSWAMGHTPRIPLEELSWISITCSWKCSNAPMCLLEHLCFLLERRAFPHHLYCSSTGLLLRSISGGPLWLSQGTLLSHSSFIKWRQSSLTYCMQGPCMERVLKGQPRQWCHKEGTKTRLTSSESGAEKYRRVAVTMGIMFGDFCLPRSRKRPCRLKVL